MYKWDLHGPDDLVVVPALVVVVAALVVVTAEVAVTGLAVVVVGDVPFKALKMAVETGLVQAAQVLRKSSIRMSQTMIPPNPFDNA